ncbi:MAG: hypothetical protein NC223_08470 [Butyrivibrio sp.]|nr:hypothetical protein [Butyrivibrio sp.]
MNKTLLKLSVGIMLVNLIVYPNYITAAENISFQNQAAETSERQEFVEDSAIYPVTPEDEEWDNLYLMEDRVNICQLSDEAISSMTTYNLLKAVCEYPLLGTMYMFTDMQEGFEVLVSQCNALKELLDREDCLSTVISEYRSYELPKEKTRVLNDDGTVFADNANRIIENKELLAVARSNARPRYVCDLLEMIMLAKSDGLAIEEQEKIIELVTEKSEEKRTSEIYGYESSSVYISNQQTMQTYSVPSKDLVGDDGTYSYTTIKSPSGRTFTVKEAEKTYMCDTDLWSSIVAETPGAHIISSASVTFNCHSYAWLSDLYPSKYQRYTLSPIPSALITDPVYHKETTPSRANEIAYWNNGWHSAKVVNTTLCQIPGTSYVSYRYISKWGGGPMVLHYANAYNGMESGITYYYSN